MESSFLYYMVYSSDVSFNTVLHAEWKICKGKCTVTFALLHAIFGELPLPQFDVPSSSVGLIIGIKGKQLRMHMIEEDAQLEKGAIKISQYEV